MLASEVKYLNLLRESCPFDSSTLYKPERFAEELDSIDSALTGGDD
jgi:hypothetical protein